KEMRAAHDKIDKADTVIKSEIEVPETMQEGLENEPEPEITRERLKEINDALFEYPENFTVFKKLKQVLDRRKLPFEDDSALVDWAHAEALAFATINQDGTLNRLTSQDYQKCYFDDRK